MAITIMGRQFVGKTCRTCGVEYYVPALFDRGKQETKDAWYCPNGHSWAYVESDADKLRRERDRLKQRQAQWEDEWRQEKIRRENAERSAAAYKGQATKLRNRAKRGVCPCCNRSFENLRRHMETQHPSFQAEATDAAE